MDGPNPEVFSAEKSRQARQISAETRDAGGAGAGGAGALLATLLLGDGRFPAGGHVHSAGVESAVADKRVTGERSLEAYLRGRLATVGLLDATFAAATVLRLTRPDADSDPALVIGELDAEVDARVVAPSLRAAARRQGRQLTRVAERCWPAALFAALRQAQPDGVHLPVVLGAVAVISGIGPLEIATVSLHHALTTPAQAAVRLLGLDPFAAAAITARLAPEADLIALEALEFAAGPIADFPARSGPLCEIGAVDHPHWDVRMFAT